jgi:hypothetical protein
MLLWRGVYNRALSDDDRNVRLLYVSSDGHLWLVYGSPLAGSGVFWSPSSLANHATESPGASIGPIMRSAE